MSDYKEPEIVLNFMKDGPATEQDALYEKAEIDLLRAALKRTDKKRFFNNDKAYENEYHV